MDTIKNINRQAPPGHVQQPRTVQPPPAVPPAVERNPYPAVGVQEENPRYARLMKVDLFSSKGEMTAIAQYLYQSWVFRRTEPEYAKQIHRIAIEEMHHLELLAELCHSLGGNPTFSVMQNNRIMPWNGTVVSYAQSINQCLRENIMGEKMTIERYLEQERSIRDQNACEVLHRIIEDERQHLAFFESYRPEDRPGERG